MVIIVGSSIFEGWIEPENALVGEAFVNTAISGSQTFELLKKIDQLIIKHKPDTVFYYCGSNDIKNNRDPEKIIRDTLETFKQIISALAKVKITYFSIIKAPQKKDQWHIVDQVNNRIKQFAENNENITFLDINPLFFDENNQPLYDLYQEDLLHLLPEAYVKLNDFVKYMEKK